WKRRRLLVPPPASPSRAVPFRVRPPVTLTDVELPDRSRSPSRVTPLKVPGAGPGSSRGLPFSFAVPPVMVPPARSQGPGLAAGFSVPPGLSRWPRRRTSPPVRVKVPRPARVKFPLRWTVALAAVIVPVLDQLLSPGGLEGVPNSTLPSVAATV